MLPRARIASDGLGRVTRCGEDMPPIDGVSGKPDVDGPVIAAKPSGSSPELPSKKVVTAFETAAREGGAEKAPGAAAAACAAGDRKSVVEGKRVSVSVELGGRHSIQKKITMP